jgi:hypothetical protein
VMGNNIAQRIEPKKRKLGEHAALIGDGSGKHHVKSGKAVRGYQEKIVSQFIEVPNLASGQQLEAGEICFPNNCAHVRRCHE